MSGRLPEGYHCGLHCQDEPRIPRCHRDLRRKGVREGLIRRKDASPLARYRRETKEALQCHCEPRIGVKQSQFSIKRDRSDAALFVYGGGGQPHKANAATVLARALLSLKVGT